MTGHELPSPTSTWPAFHTIHRTMTAVTIREFGAPEVLRSERLSVPRPSANEVLVQVAAVSVGRLLDLAARAGTHPYAKFNFPHVLGAEHSGLVADVGTDVTSVEIGQRIAVFPVITCGSCAECANGRDELCPSLELIGTHRQGAYAEYALVPAQNVHPVPADVGPVESCAIALSGATAMNQLSRAGMKPGDWVVVQAAPSALGSITATLAKHLGANVIATSRDQEKRAQCREIGFEHVLDGTAADFADEVRALTDGRGADIVVDNIGAHELWTNSLEALRRGGILVTSGAFAGREVTVDLQRLYSLGQMVLGVRTGNKESFRGVWKEVANGFRPPIGATYPLTQAGAAHRFLEEDLNVGRVALVVDRD